MGNEHNKNSRKEPIQPGDILYRPKLEDGKYQHYGVYIGNHYVIHFYFRILKEHINKFACGYQLSTKRYDEQLSRKKTVQTANYLYKNPSEFGDYNVVFNNCEHFATYCATGEKKSEQVQMKVIELCGNIITTLIDWSLSGWK